MEGGVITEDISLRDGPVRKVFSLLQSESVVWSFTSSSGHDTALAASFVPQAQAHGVYMDKVDVRSSKPYVVSKAKPFENLSEGAPLQRRV